MISLQDICAASGTGGCAVNGEELIPIDLDDLEGLDFRSVSERLLGIEDLAGPGRCICRSGLRSSADLTPLDLLLSAHCDTIMIIAGAVAVMYPAALLKQMRSALPVED